MVSRLLRRVLLAATLFGALPAHAQDSPPADSPATAPTGEVAPVRRPARPRTALDRSIRQVVQSDAEAVAALRARARAVTDPEERLAIEREIAEIKESTEEKVLRLLLADARARGRAEQVARYERSLAEMAEARMAAEAGRATTPIVRVAPR